MSPETGTLTAYAEDLIPGARNAIRTCLRVQPSESVAIVTDRETEDIAASLADQVRAVGARADTFVMEEYGPRPMLELPAAIRAALERVDVSIYAGQPKEGELAFRRALTQIIDRRQIRHAHMVSISHRIMTEAMRADFDEVDAISTRVLERAKKAQTIKATSPAGSSLVATFDPSIKWLKTSGIISTSEPALDRISSFTRPISAAVSAMSSAIDAGSRLPPSRLTTTPTRNSVPESLPAGEYYPRDSRAAGV